MHTTLQEIKSKIYDKISFDISEYSDEVEGTEYDASQFKLNGMKIICRTSKITPKKTGQFVTFWKRNTEGITAPHSESDSLDFYLINVKSKNRIGQFVFPKSELIKRGIITTKRKEGKRGFRIYPIWDNAQNKQAIKTQEWQLKFFYEITKTTNLELVKKLYCE